MKDTPRFPPVFWRVLSLFNRRLALHYGSKSKASSRVLILQTIGRKSGQPRSAPLQYEEVDGIYYVASARGKDADWYRNLLANPEVEVRVMGQHFHTYAQPITEVQQVANFIELRLKRHPHFMKIMLRLEGLPQKYSRADLEKFAERLAIVALPPSRN